MRLGEGTRSRVATRPMGSDRLGLAADAELFNQPFVAVEILRVQVIKKSATLADQAQKSATRMMVLGVGLQMTGELLDTRREERDLHLGRTAVLRRRRVSFDYFPFAGGLERHQVLLLSLPFKLQQRLSELAGKVKNRPTNCHGAIARKRESWHRRGTRGSRFHP